MEATKASYVGSIIEHHVATDILSMGSKTKKYTISTSDLVPSSKSDVPPESARIGSSIFPKKGERTDFSLNIQQKVSSNVAKSEISSGRNLFEYTISAA